MTTSRPFRFLAGTVAIIIFGVGITAPASAETPALPSIGDRIEGADRYSTSVAISKAGYPGTAATVYLASGTNFPDAISAGPAAVSAEAPLLLTRPEGIPAQVVAEIKRLQPKEIVIIGGDQSIGATAEATAKGLAEKITRIAGDDRFETSLKLAKNSSQGSTPTVHLVTGAMFPDALAAGAWGAPVILVRGEAPQLDSRTKALLNDLSPNEITIVGGENSVSEGILDDSRAFSPTVARFSGYDRYATAAALARNWGAASAAFVASGQDYPDALTGGTLAAKRRVPLVLSGPDCLNDEALSALLTLRVQDLTVLGGKQSLSKNFANYAYMCPVQ